MIKLFNCAALRTTGDTAESEVAMAQEDLNLRNSIKIAYYDPFSIFPTVKSEFISRLPLTNLHWKYHPLKPVKSIPILPVQLQEEVPSSHHTSKPLQPAFENVYLRLIFVKAESMEVYRSQMRPLIEAWLSQLVMTTKVHWSIILIVPAPKMDKKSTLIKTSIYDKLKIDFGPLGKHICKLRDATKQEGFDKDEGHDNIFKIMQSYTDESSKIQDYNHVFARFKSLLLQTFDLRYNNYIDETERLQKIALNDSEAMIALFLSKLKTMRTLSDMRFLSESFEIYLELAEALKVLLKNAKHAFDNETWPLPEKIEHSVVCLSEHDSNLPVDQFSGYTAQKTPINLFLTKLGLFSSASLLLQSLANIATSLSVSSLHLLSLLQKLILFTNDIGQNYPNTAPINEWLYSLIDFYLELPLTKQLLELSSQSGEENSPVNVTEILEYTAELELLKRSILGKLAVAKGFELPESGTFLEDVPLDSDSDIKIKEVKLTYKPLIKDLKNQKSYEKAFESLTVSAIQYFASCDRSRTIDLLSIDLAILHYRREEYKDAYEILLTSYEYFIQHGWKFMGGMLLEMYLKCLEKFELGDNRKLLISHLKLFSLLKTANTSGLGINNHGLIRPEKQRLQLLQNIYDTSHKLKEPMLFPLENFFAPCVSSFIKASTESLFDVYTITADIQNNFSIDIKLDGIEVKLLNVLTGDELSFSSQNIVLKKLEKQAHILNTSVFREGRYELLSITFKVTEKLLFMQNFTRSNQAAQDETVIRYGINDSQNEENHVETEGNQKYFHMYPDSNKLRVEIFRPVRTEMGVSSALVTIQNGQSNIEDILVNISNGTSGVQLKSEDTKAEVKSINAGKTWSKVIPFTYFGESKELKLDIDIAYRADDSNYEHHASLAYDTSLPIAISVQDIFRRNSLFSKFQLAQANGGNPIRIIDAKFVCPANKYDVTGSLAPDETIEPLLVFGGQPAYLFYQVQPNKQIESSDSLDLTLTFSDLQRECEEIITQRLWEALGQCNLQNYFFVLKTELPKMKFDFTAYSFYNRVVVENTQNCIQQLWASLDLYVPEPEDCKLLVKALKTLTETTTVDDVERFFSKQELYIPVAMPFLGMLHLVNIEFDRKPQFFVGEPIDARLCIDSTAKWRDSISSPILASLSPVGKHTPRSQSYHYSLVHEDNWIISGFTKQDFEVEEDGSQQEFSITLVPLNVGELQLPKINVIPNSEFAHSMDVVNENALETVLVVPELNSITFSF